jgi:ubiquitin carboxyl-terminal hydrolase 36/42
MRFLIDNLASCARAQTKRSDRAHPQVCDTTWVHQLWGGIVRSRVECLSCHHMSDSKEPTLDLSLPMPRDSENLFDLLAAWRRPEYLRGDNKYKCDKCKNLVEARKSNRILQSPPNLMIHLSRFSCDVFGRIIKKISRQIDYPLYLDIQSSLTDESVSLQTQFDFSAHS